MDDRKISTSADLDAAIAAQRARKLESLRRLANLSYFWFLSLPVAAMACFLVAYLTDRNWMSLAGIGVLGVSLVSGYFQIKSQRRAAAAELAAEEARSA